MVQALDQLGVAPTLERSRIASRASRAGPGAAPTGGAAAVGLPVQVGTLRHESLDHLRDPGRLDLGVTRVAEDVRQPAELVAKRLGDGAVEERASRGERRAKSPVDTRMAWMPSGSSR